MRNHNINTKVKIFHPTTMQCSDIYFILTDSLFYYFVFLTHFTRGIRLFTRTTLLSVTSLVSRCVRVCACARICVFAGCVCEKTSFFFPGPSHSAHTYNIKQNTHSFLRRHHGRNIRGHAPRTFEAQFVSYICMLRTSLQRDFV